MPNGDLYQGFLRNGKKNGRGVLKFNNGVSTELDGFWKEDRLMTKAVL